MEYETYLKRSLPRLQSILGTKSQDQVAQLTAHLNSVSGYIKFSPATEADVKHNRRANDLFLYLCSRPEEDQKSLLEREPHWVYILYDRLMELLAENGLSFHKVRAEIVVKQKFNGVAIKTGGVKPGQFAPKVEPKKTPKKDPKKEPEKEDESKKEPEKEPEKGEETKDSIEEKAATNGRDWSDAKSDSSSGGSVRNYAEALTHNLPKEGEEEPPSNMTQLKKKGRSKRASGPS